MAAVAEVEVELWMCNNASSLPSLSPSLSLSVSLSHSLSSLCVGVDAVRDTLTTKNLVGNRARQRWAAISHAAPRYRE